MTLHNPVIYCNTILDKGKYFYMKLYELLDKIKSCPLDAEVRFFDTPRGYAVNHVIIENMIDLFEGKPAGSRLILSEKNIRKSS